MKKKKKRCDCFVKVVVISGSCRLEFLNRMLWLLEPSEACQVIKLLYELLSLSRLNNLFTISHVVRSVINVFVSQKKREQTDGVNVFSFLCWKHGVHELKEVLILLSLVFVSPELSSVRDYVITHSVRSMYAVCVCMW